MNTASAAVRRHGDRPFVLRRSFAAPRERVWRAWTTVDELQQWFCPAGFTVSHATLDLRPGGGFHYAMRSLDGAHEMWGRWVFRVINAPQRIELLHSFSDAQGGITTHPLDPSWPRELLSTTTFTEEEGQTTMELRWTVWNGTPEEHQTFDADCAHEGMTQGWTGTLDKLTSHLAAHP